MLDEHARKRPMLKQLLQLPSLLFNLSTPRHPSLDAIFLPRPRHPPHTNIHPTTIRIFHRYHKSFLMRNTTGRRCKVCSHYNDVTANDVYLRRSTGAASSASTYGARSSVTAGPGEQEMIMTHGTRIGSFRNLAALMRKTKD